MIRTSHVGSLPRPPDLLAAIAERKRGGPSSTRRRCGPRWPTSVRRQVDVGLDIVNDGETAKVSYVTYVRNRLTGFAARASPPSGRDPAADDFPGVCRRRRAAAAAAAPVQLPVCRDEIRYRGHRGRRRRHRRAAGRAGRPSRARGVPDRRLAGRRSRCSWPNEHYRDREAYLDALAEAMKTEYDAVHAAGLLLQLDCPDLRSRRAAFPPDDDGLRRVPWLRRAERGRAQPRAA